jgi:homoserine O-acetyltransferase
VVCSAPLLQQGQAPTRDQADSAFRAYLDNRMWNTDANDVHCQFDASRGHGTHWQPRFWGGLLREFLLALH